jgi:hypothetical protein
MEGTLGPVGVWKSGLISCMVSIPSHSRIIFI